MYKLVQVGYTSNMNDFVEILKSTFETGEPILTEDILATFPHVARSTTFNRIKVTVEVGTLAQFSRGVYYIPERTTLFGKEVELPLDADKVIKRKYLEQNGYPIGFISGQALENRCGVNIQVPGVLEITTNAETNRSRKIGAIGGYREVILKRPRIPITQENAAALEAIELISNVDTSTLDNGELNAFRAKIAAVPKAKLLACLTAYPKRVMSKYLEGASRGLIPT